MTLLQRQSVDIIASDPDEGNTVVVQLAQLGDVRTVSDDGATSYREAFDSLVMADRVHVKDSHGGDVIGHADINTFRSDPDPTIDLSVADTSHGRDLMALVRNGTIGAVSVEFAPGDRDAEDDDGVMRRNATVGGIAFAFRPAHNAPILATREETPNEETTMPTFESEVPGDAVTPNDLETLGDELRREMLTIQPAAAADPHSKFNEHGSMTDFMLANRDTDEGVELLHRVLADQISTANTGVIPEGWVKTVAGIISRGRPTITAFGTGGLPSAGMDINWPFYAGDFTALVAAQATEKTAIESVTVDVDRGTVALATYAGGSDISYQLLRRSDPSYRQAYDSIMAIGYAATTDAVANAAALTAATAGTVWAPTTGDADGLRASLFDASVAVEAATGAPAEFAVVATDVYLAIGGLAGLWPAPYGTYNTAGTADAASLRINVSGLPVIHDQYSADGTFIVSNSNAATWFEEGPMGVQAEDVEKLGLNVALWGMGAFAPILPAGIINIPAA